MIRQKLEYIHANPCRGSWSLAECPIDYAHSSAKFYLAGSQGVYEVTSYADLADIDLTKLREVVTKTVTNTATREASSLEGYTAKGNVTLTSVTVNADTYVKAVANETGTPGIAPIGGTISVKPGEGYSFKVMGYQSAGTAAYLYVSSGSGDIVWTGAQLPTGTTNGIVTSTFTVPAGVTQLSVGVRWNGAAVGNTVFINRVMLYRSDWEYQYFLSDQLGSPRVVLQTAPHTFTYTATMESQNYSDNAPSVGEGSVFLNLKSTNEIVFTAANATIGGTRAYVMNSANRVGPGKSFKVFPGDKIDASAMGYYIAGGTYTKTAATAMGGAISSILGVNIPGAVDALGQAYSLAGNGNAAFAALSPDKGTSQPSAFINYILFDETFTPIEGKSQAVGGTPGVISPINLPTVTVNQTGYLYVYLSYDNDTGGADVFFDEFKITYQESPVIQVNSYYPFGLTAFSWLREGETENKYLFQGKELESLTGLQDFGSRMYWGDLGRWFATDPQSQFSSPYMAMGNLPTIGIDPDGELWGVLIGAAFGAYQGSKLGEAVGASGWGMFGYVLGGATIGALSGGVGEAVISSGGAFANTAAIFASSAVNSGGMKILSGGRTDLTLSFGAFSINLDKNEFGYLGKEGNSTLEDVGYGFGALANIQDVFAGSKGGVVSANARKEPAGHHWLEGKDHDDNPINISVGPAEKGKGDLNNLPEGKINNLKWETQYLFRTVKGRNFITNYDPNDIFSIKLNNVNVSKLRTFTENLDKGLSLGGKQSLKYGVWNGCVNQTSRALFKAGVFNFNAFLPITAPVLLNAELALRNYGMMFSYYATSYK